MIFRPFETPLYGVSGVAISLVISEIAALLIMIFIVFKQMHIGIRLRYLRPFPFGDCLRIIMMGFPAGVEALSYNLAQIVVTTLITGLGAEVLSARVYLQNIVSFVYLLGMSVGQGVQIIVGNRVGAGDYGGARAANKRGIRLALLSNVVLSLLAILFRKPLLGLFTTDSVIIAIAAPIIIFDMTVEIFRAVNHIMVYSPARLGRCALYHVRCAVFHVGGQPRRRLRAGIRTGSGASLGFWMGFAADEGFRAVIAIFRWRSGRWENKRVVS